MGPRRESQLAIRIKAPQRIYAPVPSPELPSHLISQPSVDSFSSRRSQGRCRAGAMGKAGSYCSCLPGRPQGPPLRLRRTLEQLTKADSRSGCLHRRPGSGRPTVRWRGGTRVWSPYGALPRKWNVQALPHSDAPATVRAGGVHRGGRISFAGAKD